VPNLQVAGTYSPPFRPAGVLEDRDVLDRIDESGADVVWVGLGTPKQDFWVAQHRPLLRAPLLAAVGAAFDFHAGLIPQAPGWMQRRGLEWLYRLSHEPRRLWYRYLVYNPLFMAHVILQITRLRDYRED
jgi:N-acetylglucosaminyldiphosphoundecaprenol N-acetyl-beta-D-mannosaminyltransferase